MLAQNDSCCTLPSLIALCDKPLPTPPASPAHSGCGTDQTQGPRSPTPSGCSLEHSQAMHGVMPTCMNSQGGGDGMTEKGFQLELMQRKILVLQAHMKEQEALLASLLHFRAQLMLGQADMQALRQERDAALAQNQSLMQRIQELEAAAKGDSAAPVAGVAAAASTD